MRAPIVTRSARGFRRGVRDYVERISSELLTGFLRSRDSAGVMRPVAEGDYFSDGTIRLSS